MNIIPKGTEYRCLRCGRLFFSAARDLNRGLSLCPKEDLVLPVGMPLAVGPCMPWQMLDDKRCDLCEEGVLLHDDLLKSHGWRVRPVNITF